MNVGETEDAPGRPRQSVTKLRRSSPTTLTWEVRCFPWCLYVFRFNFFL